MHNLRLKFLESCWNAEIIPRFLAFRIPNNGFFDNKSVHDFQKNLLKKELAKVCCDINTSQIKVDGICTRLRGMAPSKCLPSIIVYIRLYLKSLCEKKNENSMVNYSVYQKNNSAPLFNVNNTVICCNLTLKPPKYVC